VRRVKAAILLSKSTSIDITPEELTAEWQKLSAIDGVEFLFLPYDRRPTGQEVSERVPADTEALFGVWIQAEYLNEDFFARHPKLRYVATLAHGYGEIDFEMARRHGVTITNTAYGDTTIAEYAFALLLALCHRVELHSDYVKNTRWWEPDAPKYMYSLTPRIELHGKTFGILGLGKIGLCAARIAQGFGMHVISHSLYVQEGPAFRDIEQVALAELYARSDVLSVHAPLTAQTRGMLNRAAFAAMRDGVLLLNTARGQLICEPDLIEALKSGKVGGAGLDVLCEEPPIGPNELLTFPNVLVTGHIAWLPKTSRMRQVSLAIDNFKAYLAGRPVSVVNGTF
jgi:glycerate dehydrogenase